ncbi:MAG: hypothetical protein ACYDBY_20650 [Thermoanaerobaculia bacterium]
MQTLAFVVAVALSAQPLTGPVADAKPPKEKPAKSASSKSGGPARKDGPPPGLAKKGGLPPGLAKKLGPTPPENVYIAFDRRHDDRAWFLIEGEWILKSGFEPSVRSEVRASLSLPPLPAPPPVPLPKIGAELHVVLFP